MKNYLLILLIVLASVSAQGQVNDSKPIQLSLQEAIDYAIKNNYNARVAQKDIESANQEKWETTTIGLPQIDGKIDYINNLKRQFPGVDFNQDGTVDFNARHSVNAGVTLRQLLFDGSYLVGLQSAKTFLQISKQAKEKTELVTREAVVNAYGNVLITEMSIAIVEENKKVVEKNLNDTRKIFQNGLTEEEDVEQLEITFGNLKNQLNSVKRMKSIAYQMLNIVLGNPVDTKLELTDSLDSLTKTNIDLGLVAEPFNLENHIDYKIAQNDRESKRLMMKYEQSQALPKLSAFVNYNYIANAESFDFFSGSQQWINTSAFGVTMNIPIFSSLKRSSKTQRAKINLEIADIKLKEKEQQLSLQVKTAKSDYQFSIDNYETAKKNLKLAQRIEKKQRVKFFEGISSSFELAQAQNQLYTQQEAFIQSMLDVIAKKAALENALNIPIKTQ